MHDVRVVSQSRREDTVSALVTWEPASTSASGHLYLVSWQAQGDALRGNLLTNTPSTTLSLLPDTVYDLQVNPSLSLYGKYLFTIYIYFKLKPLFTLRQQHKPPYLLTTFLFLLSILPFNSSASILVFSPSFTNHFDARLPLSSW